MEMMDGQAMTVLRMMNLSVLVSLGLSENRIDRNMEIQPQSIDSAYPINLPAVKRLLLYGVEDSHPQTTHYNLVRSAPSLTHLVLSPTQRPGPPIFEWLNIRAQDHIEGEMVVFCVRVSQIFQFMTPKLKESVWKSLFR